MKKILSLTLCLLLAAGFTFSGLACTALYVGASLTDDGSTIFARSEDYSNCQNKLFYVSPAGLHAEGEVYDGCYGFQWTFTHDSYGYTAFSDDNGAGVDGVCPDCGQTHPHTPYEAAGTNDQGVSVTCTETLGCSEEIEAVDPYEDAGIEEAEMVTILLGESATAQEAVELITGIYTEYGSNSGSGIIIADSDETWYIENVSGHEYIALKLSDDMVFVQPNMSIIGAIDTSDENVLCSPKLFEVAQEVGTFVGDAEAGVIDYVASYNGGSEANQRMKNALVFFGATDDAEGEPDPALYLITNLDADGALTALHTGIQAQEFGIADAQAFYQVSGIGYARNLETHIFQTYEFEPLHTVEWVAMDDASCNVFVPYLPMMTSEVYAAYQVSTPMSTFVEDAEPTEGFTFPTTINRWTDEGRVAVDGWMILPEGWAESYYWTFDALTNLVSSGLLSDEQVASVREQLGACQAEVNDAFAAELEGIFTAPTQEEAGEKATAFSMATAQNVHALALDLVNGLIAE